MRALPLIACLVLSACVVVEPPPRPMPPRPVPVHDACRASELQYLVGQPARVLQTMRFSTEVRIIRPGMAVTMDYRDNRLNIEIGRGERIRRVYCG